MREIELGGRVAVVTGASRGLGLAQARALKEAGARVVMVARELQTLREAQHSLEEAAGPEVAIRAHDMRDHAAADALVAGIEADVGPIHALVNNAGVHLKKPIWDVELDEWRGIVETNLTGVYSLTREVLRRMMPRRAGAIVNISSMAGLMALPSAAGYVTTKTALVGLTRSIAVDAGAHGIRCNAVCPGFIDTEMTRKVLAGDPARAAKIRGRIPMPRLGLGEDIADACLFLCSDLSSYVNGQVLAVDGGYSVGF